MSLEDDSEIEKKSPDPLRALRQAIGNYSEEDIDEIPSATYWPTIATEDLSEEWEKLRNWVRELQNRFEHLDHHIIPYCWFRHNEHVEALSALRDYEASSFSPTSPSTAPVDWFRALRDISQMLKSFTSELSCGLTHQDSKDCQVLVSQSEFNIFVQLQIKARSSGEIHT